MGYQNLLRPLMAISSLATLSMAAYPEISDDRCDCYLTNGSSNSYFSSHKFFDFRDRTDQVNVPAVIEDADESSEASPANDYLASAEWTEYWTLQGWNNRAALEGTASDASVLMVHSPNNVYFEKNEDENAGSNTYLTMRTARLDDFQTACEFESNIRNYQFLSSRMYARTIGAPGAVTAMFTYRDVSGSTELADIQESDIEFRTLDPPDRVQYTNQPSYTVDGDDLEEATRNVTIPNALDWSDWAVYRMDWSPGKTTWYIDGHEAAAISFQAPRDPSMLIFNSWSDGGTWTGNMSVGLEAKFQIQWIELVYNTTSEEEQKGEGTCFNVCSIDEREEVGTTSLLQGDSSRAVISWMTLLCLALLAW